MPEIVRIQHISSIGTAFVAIGNLLSGTESTHSAFIIRYNSRISAFHFTGYSIDFEEMGRDYYHIETPVIHKDEVPAFIALCLNIQKKANPLYGFFYSGESYDFEGNHRSDTDLGEVMTCAGFCLNVLKGFLEEDYIAYADWENIPYPNLGYATRFCNENGLDINKIQPSHRRITPRECLISCMFDVLPIRKSQIDAAQQMVQDFFEGQANQT